MFWNEEMRKRIRWIEYEWFEEEKAIDSDGIGEADLSEWNTLERRF